MSMTQIDIDDDALAEAMRLMGTSTKKTRWTLHCASTPHVSSA